MESLRSDVVREASMPDETPFVIGNLDKAFPGVKDLYMSFKIHDEHKAAIADAFIDPLEYGMLSDYEALCALGAGNNADDRAKCDLVTRARVFSDILAFAMQSSDCDADQKMGGGNEMELARKVATELLVEAGKLYNDPQVQRDMSSLQTVEAQANYIVGGLSMHMVASLRDANAVCHQLEPQPCSKPRPKPYW